MTKVFTLIPHFKALSIIVRHFELKYYSRDKQYCKMFCIGFYFLATFFFRIKTWTKDVTSSDAKHLICMRFCNFTRKYDVLFEGSDYRRY